MKNFSCAICGAVLLPGADKCANCGSKVAYHEQSSIYSDVYISENQLITPPRM